MKKSKTNKPVLGDIVELPLSGDHFGYGRVLKHPLMAFYAIRSATRLDSADVLKGPVVFKVWVMDSAVKSGRWKVIGNAPVEKELEESPWFFKQDIISKKLSLYRDGVERPATAEECARLESASVWSAEHVEERLDDYFAGRPSKWVQVLKIKT